MHMSFVLCGSVYCFNITVLLASFIGVDKPARICVECQHANLCYVVLSSCLFKSMFRFLFIVHQLALFKDSVFIKAAVSIKCLYYRTDSKTRVLRNNVPSKKILDEQNFSLLARHFSHLCKNILHTRPVQCTNKKCVTFNFTDLFIFNLTFDVTK